MSKKIWFLVGLMIAIAAAMFFVSADRSPQKPPPPPVSELDLLISVETARGTISVDPVEWLQGEEAVQAALKVYPECTRKNIEDCAATLANNFYVYNKIKESLTYSVPPGAVIRVLSGGSAEFQPGPSNLADLSARLEGLPPASRLVRLTRTGDKVSYLEEVYMP